MSKRMMAIFVAVTVAVLQPAFGPVLHAQGPREGIKVHGHWVIDVRQPDGTLVSHTEFENALTSGGANLLGRLLGRQSAMGRWVVWVTGPCQFAQLDHMCRLDEGSTLELAHQPGAGVLLRGSFRANQTNPVIRVATEATYCEPTTAPVNCDAGASLGFSATDLPSPVAVTIGQLVEITVTLSFS